MERGGDARGDRADQSLIKEAVAAGALGFTTTAIPQHIGYKGRPIACRNASRDEFKAYANALKELGRGSMELALTKSVSVRWTTKSTSSLDFLLTESEPPDDVARACSIATIMPEACSGDSAQGRSR